MAGVVVTRVCGMPLGKVVFGIAIFASSYLSTIIILIFVYLQYTTVGLQLWSLASDAAHLHSAAIRLGLWQFRTHDGRAGPFPHRTGRGRHRWAQGLGRLHPWSQPSRLLDPSASSLLCSQAAIATTKVASAAYTFVGC